MVDSAKEESEKPDLGQGLVYHEIIDESVIGHRPKTRADLWMLGSAMRMTGQAVQITNGIPDATSGPRRRAIFIFAKASIGLNKMLFDKLQIARDLDGRNDPIGHARVSFAPAWRRFRL